MLRQWILNLVYKIRHIPGVKNYADILTKALSLEPFARFRDAILNAKIVFPSDTKSTDVSTSYITRLATYIEHACTLDETATSCLCTSGVDHCQDSDLCSSHCCVCSIDSVVAPSLPLGAGGDWNGK